MTRKIINRVSPGTVDIFGADDLNYVNRLLTGVDQSATDPVDINTAWMFRNSKLQLASPSDITKKYTFISSAIADNRNLTIPLLTGDDTIVTTGAGLTTGQTLTNKTIAYGSNTLTDVVGTTATQTLTNKTIDAGANPTQRLYAYPDIKSVGGYFGGDFDTFGGIYQGGSRGTPAVDNDGRTFPVDNTEGRYCRMSTNQGTTPGAGAQTGHSMGSEGVGGITRGLTFRFKIKFRMVSASSVRYYIGLKGTGSDLVGDTPITTSSCFFVFYSTGVSSTQVYLEHNDTTSPSTRDNLATKDGNIHTFEVVGNSTNMRYWWDGVGPTTVTTDIPSTTSILYPVCWAESSSSSADSLDVWYWYVETPYSG